MKISEHFKRKNINYIHGFYSFSANIHINCDLGAMGKNTPKQWLGRVLKKMNADAKNRPGFPERLRTKIKRDV